MNFTLLSPVHNEEDNIRPFYDAACRTLDATDKTYEVLFVDDGSSDRSLQVIRELAAGDKRVRWLRLERNYGKTTALDAGFKQARGEIIFTIDCDLQYDPADLLRLWRELDDPGVAAAFGARTNSASGWIKKLSSRTALKVRNSILGQVYHGSSLGAYRRECLTGITLYEGFEVFLPPLLWQQGFATKEIPVQEHPRQRGTSKHGVRNRLLPGLCGLFILRWMQRHRVRYRIMEQHVD